MKDTMTSFDIAAITFELSQAIKEARVNNIYQINTKTILLKLHQPDVTLLVEAGKRVHLTSYRIKKPQVPSNFCRALRKHLNNGIIRSIHQHEFDRIIILNVVSKYGVFDLVCEIFGRGNIILVGKGKILQALTYRRMKDRNILRGETFQQPPPSGLNPIKTTRQQIEDIRGLGGSVVKGLVNLLSLGGAYAEEILLRARIVKTTLCKDLTDQQIDRIFQFTKVLVSPFSTGKLDPCIVEDQNGGWIDVLPFPLLIYSGLTTKHYSSFNGAADDYFTKLAAKRFSRSETEKIEQQIMKQKRILEQQQKRLEQIRSAAAKHREVGNLIYAHAGELQSLFDKIVSLKESGKKWHEISSNLIREKKMGQSPARLLESIDPKRGIVLVDINGVRFTLVFYSSLHQNATKYYAKAKKAEEKLRGAEKAVKETKERLRALEGQQVETVGRLPRLVKERKKAWYEKFHWCRSSEGLLIVGGKDAVTNEVLIKRYMEPSDIVLHADIPGAPFVLIKTEGKTPSEKTLREAAQLSASYSRAWREGLRVVDVYWVRPAQLSKKPPSGEYLKRGAFMIYGPRNNLKDVPLKIAIGIVKVNQHLMVIGGPPSSIENQTDRYVKVVPGSHPSLDLARAIKLELVKKSPMELQAQVKEIPIEEFQKFIPAGKGEITVDNP